MQVPWPLHSLPSSPGHRTGDVTRREVEMEEEVGGVKRQITREGGFSTIVRDRVKNTYQRSSRHP